MAKTAPKTPQQYAPAPPRGGARLPLGNHPGNTGGKKGRSGRKPNAFIAKCIAATEDSTLWQEARDKHPLGVLNLAANYAHGKPKESLDVSGEVKIVVEYEE